MRLWQKISIVCIVVLFAVVAVMSALLLYSARSNIISLTVTNAKEKQVALAKSFANMAEYSISESMSQPEAETEVLRCFATFADDTGVLVRGYDTLASFVRMEPQDILPISTPEQQVFFDDVGARNYLIVGSLVTIERAGADFAVYIVRDISDVYQSSRNMAVKFAIIAVAGVMLGVGAIMLLAHTATRPLKTLGLSARRIADGKYEERANVHTNDEIGALADDFNRMAGAVQEHIAALEERNERQNLFIGGLTHEFKTPMTSMMLHSETLLNNPLLTQEQRETSLMHIRTQCGWLERLTQKLMSLVTLGKDIAPVRQPVERLFERVEESTRETLLKRGTPLVTECHIDMLSFDIDLLQSLFINLVDNASKASENGQTILLSAHGRTISVRDSGRGIPPDAIARVTEPFYMVDQSRSKRMGGSGLGLALVKRIADAHGATLSIESEPGVGTTVSVTLPEDAAGAREAE